MQLDTMTNVGGEAMVEVPLHHDRDNAELTRLGKKPVLKRNFGFVSMLAFSCTVMVTWEGVLLSFAISFTDGGFSGSVYEYIFVWIGTLAAFSSMGELASMAPTAGGQYHWTSMLAPKFCRKIFSYFIGWHTMLGWHAIVASGCSVCAYLVRGLMILSNSSYRLNAWELLFLYWAILVLALSVNTLISRQLPNIESFILIHHMFGFFAILIPLVYFAPHGDAKAIFTSFNNGGAWPNDGTSFLIGCLGPAYSLLGADSAAHMSEEIRNAAVNVPRAMVFSILLNGTLGFGMLISALFCVGNTDLVLHSATHISFMEIFRQAVGSLSGALTMASLVTILIICANISFVATASRMTWAFSRDRGTPGWQILRRVEPRTTLPLMSIAVTMIIATIFSLIGLGSTTAFSGLGMSCLYTSYFIGNTFLLWRRLTGSIKPYSIRDKILANTPEADYLTWGPWKITEPFGTIINAFGCAYLFVVMIFSFWPTKNHPRLDNMNYSSLVYGAFTVIIVFYYFLWGKRTYTGPVVEIHRAEARCHSRIYRPRL
ncbi:hypothetical protein DPSP01_013619 [Paraphaeosphaeria sporulosa]